MEGTGQTNANASYNMEWEEIFGFDPNEPENVNAMTTPQQAVASNIPETIVPEIGGMAHAINEAGNPPSQGQPSIFDNVAGMWNTQWNGELPFQQDINAFDPDLSINGFDPNLSFGPNLSFHPNPSFNPNLSFDPNLSFNGMFGTNNLHEMNTNDNVSYGQSQSEPFMEGNNWIDNTAAPQDVQTQFMYNSGVMGGSRAETTEELSIPQINTAADVGAPDGHKLHDLYQSSFAGFQCTPRPRFITDFGVDYPTQALQSPQLPQGQQWLSESSVGLPEDFPVVGEPSSAVPLAGTIQPQSTSVTSTPKVNAPGPTASLKYYPGSYLPGPIGLGQYMSNTPVKHSTLSSSLNYPNIDSSIPTFLPRNALMDGSQSNAVKPPLPPSLPVSTTGSSQQRKRLLISDNEALLEESSPAKRRQVHQKQDRTPPVYERTTHGDMSHMAYQQNKVGASDTFSQADPIDQSPANTTRLAMSSDTGNMLNPTKKLLYEIKQTLHEQDMIGKKLRYQLASLAQAIGTELVKTPKQSSKQSQSTANSRRGNQGAGVATISRERLTAGINEYHSQLLSRPSGVSGHAGTNNTSEIVSQQQLLHGIENYCNTKLPEQDSSHKGKQDADHFNAFSGV